MLTRKMIMGITLLETLFALAVGALVLVGALLFYTSITQNSNVNKTVSDMNAIVTAYRAYALGHVVTAATTIATLQNSNLLPNPFLNPWGAGYDAAVTVGNKGTAPTTVTIHIWNIRGAGQTGGDPDCAAIGQTAQPTAQAVNSTQGCFFQYTL